MPAVTTEQLENAAIDCEVLGNVVNGAADLNGTGLVPTRTGGDVKTLNKIAADMEANSRFQTAAWSDLAAIVNRVAGAVAEVPTTDSGTHTDPVVGGTVNNSGVFRWSASPAGWQRIANFTAPDIATAGDMSSASKAATPAHVAASQKITGFPDQFFRQADLSKGFWLGRMRWWLNSASFTRGSGFALVDGTLYRGKKIQVTSTGSELQGLSVLLDELSAVAGETITVYILATVSAGTLYAPGYFSTAPIGGTTGGQKNPVNDAGGATLAVTATARWLRFEQVIPAGGVKRFSVAPYVSSSGAAEIHAMWAFKGAATSGPALPVVEEPATATKVALLENAALWRGKKNLIPDPFFRIFNYPDALYGDLPTWTPATTFSSFAKVANPFYSGFALRKTGTASLSGPRLNLASVGLIPGDIVSFAAELAGIEGQTSTPRMYLRCFDSGGVATAAQQTMVDVDGFHGTKTAGGAKFTVSASLTIPANTAYIWFYPANAGTSGDVMDLVSLWGVKGAASQLPLVPPLGDDPEVLDTYTGATSLVERTEALEATSSYAFFERTAVGYTALSSVLGANSYSTFPRALVFSGWGTKLTPAGVSFNAIRVPLISRTATTEASKWHTLNVVIRTGANSQNAGAAIIAVGSVLVNPEADELVNTIFVLKDDTSGAIKTLTDADYIDGEYSVMVYALNADGQPAACGEGRGDLPNFEGNSFYATTGNAKTGSWLNNSGDGQFGYEHLLLTDPVETLAKYPTSGFVVDLQTELSSAIPAPEVITPPAVFGVQGQECNIYFDNLFLDDAADYNINFDSSGSVGSQQNERWTWTPSGAVTTGNATISVHDKRTGTLLVSKTIAQRAAALTAGSGTTKKVVFIGDSLVNAGTITQTLLEIADPDAMDVTLIGTRGSGLNKHEGRGGFTVDDYTTVGRTYYQFDVSGVTVAPAINSTEYSHNGSVYRVQEINLSGGTGTLVCSVTSGGAPLSTGTLTKASGAGDSSINFSVSTAVSGNPFWISGALNFPQWLTNNSFDIPDWVFIQLGTNDNFSSISDAAANSFANGAFTKLDNLITSIKAAGAGVKVGIVLPPPPSAEQNAFGANYTTGQPRWRVKRNYLIWVRQMIAKYLGQEASRIYLVPSNVNLDTVNNYPVAAAAPVNSRNTAVTVVRQNNSVHPFTPGYQQISDAVWAFLKYYASA